MTTQIQLTELGAVNPYGICLDDENCLWIASKGGLFRINQTGECLFAEKHAKPKSMSAFSSVSRATSSNGQTIIFTKFSEVNSDETHLVLYGLDGQRTASNIVDGVVKSATITTNGDIILSIRKKQGCNEILKTNIDEFYSFTPLITTSEEVEYQYIAASSEKNLIAISVAKLPVNPYSVQEIQLYDYNSGQFLRNIGQFGKEQGQFWCIRALHLDADGNLLILDKTGRVQKISTANGDFLHNVAVMPSGLVNGFCVNERQNRIYLTCSGLIEEIVDDKTEIICNDWIEVLEIAS